MLERKLFICTPQRTWVRSLVSAALIFAATGCGGAKNPIPINPAGIPLVPTIQHALQDVLGGSFVVEPGKYKTFTVAVTAAMRNPSVEGTFSATGGNNDIEVFVLEESQYLNWQNGLKFAATYISGRVTSAKLKIQLPETGTYHVVFSNRFSYITNKAVVADVKLAFGQAD
jgi:hypothetical protein